MTQQRTAPAEAEAQARATASAEAMWASDDASRAMGMELRDVGPGRARMRMIVRDDMVQGHGTCHGGVLFSLCDSDFACNSHGEVPGGCTASPSSPRRPDAPDEGDRWRSQ